MGLSLLPTKEGPSRALRIATPLGGRSPGPSLSPDSIIGVHGEMVVSKRSFDSLKDTSESMIRLCVND